MPLTKRIQKEFDELQEDHPKFIRDIKMDDANMLHWELLVTPEHAPYSKGMFRIEIRLPEQYPFKPPYVKFKTKIYHPNVDETGNVCLPIITADHWKPGQKLTDVVSALAELIKNPEPEHPLRSDLAEEFLSEKKKFMKNAEEFTKKHGEKRTS